jgi:hypothetical protein
MRPPLKGALGFRRSRQDGGRDPLWGMRTHTVQPDESRRLLADRLRRLDPGRVIARSFPLGCSPSRFSSGTPDGYEFPKFSPFCISPPQGVHPPLLAILRRRFPHPGPSLIAPGSVCLKRNRLLGFAGAATGLSRVERAGGLHDPRWTPGLGRRPPDLGLHRAGQ